MLGCEAWGNKTKEIILRLCNEWYIFFGTNSQRQVCLSVLLRYLRDGPLEKWCGGWGKNQTKINARENAKRKNSCKEEGKEKKFMQKEGPIVTFSESLNFFSESLCFRNQQYYQAQWPQKINMRVTTSQCEISRKNHIWSVKTFSSWA